MPPPLNLEEELKKNKKPITVPFTKGDKGANEMSDAGG